MRCLLSLVAYIKWASPTRACSRPSRSRGACFRSAPGATPTFPQSGWRRNWQALQNNFHVGILPRHVPGRDLDRRRGAVPLAARAPAAWNRARSASQCLPPRLRRNGSCNLRCAGYIEYVMEKEGGVGAVIAETVRNTGVIPPPDYWKRVRAARTGRMFSCEHHDVVPDILVVGKSLGGALFPLAGIIAREELDVAPHTALGHYTHEKNPVACTAALATIEF